MPHGLVARPHSSLTRLDPLALDHLARPFDDQSLFLSGFPRLLKLHGGRAVAGQPASSPQ